MSLSKIDVLRTASNVSEHIDLMDFLNHNAEPLLKELGSPYTHFLWTMMADKPLTAALNRFETEQGDVVYMLGMTHDGLDYVITTKGGKEPRVDPLIKHKARLWDTFEEQFKANKLRVTFMDEPRRFIGEVRNESCLHRYLDYIHLEQEAKNA
jgi:hypothetical protein